MDILIATVLGHHPTQYQPLPHTFREYVQVLQNITKLSEEADELHDHADFCESLAHWNILNNEDDADPNVEALRLEAREARQKADKLVQFTNNLKIFTHHTDPSSFPFLHNNQITSIRLQEPFTTEDGPCVQALERALSEVGVQRQAYFGGTFIGNHVHTCCKVYNVKSDLTSKFH